MPVISPDMDGQKRINDTHGHVQGAGPHSLGDIIRGRLRQELAARIGGDGFLAAFVGKNIEGRAREIVCRMEQGIEEYNKVSGKEYKRQTGIGSYPDWGWGHSLDYFLKKAEDLIYACKYNHKKSRGLMREDKA